MRFAQAIALLACSALAPCRVAAQQTRRLHVTDGKLTVVDSVGIAAATLEFDSAQPSSPLAHRALGPGDTLRLAFNVKEDGADGQPVQPHQAAILWEPLDTEERTQRGRDHQSVVKVRKGGKAKWELDLSRASTSLLSVSRGSISASLVIGHPGFESVRVQLGSFTLPTSLALPFPYPADDTLPKAWQVEHYATMPEIHWTFRAKEKRVPFPIAFAGVLVVAAPWIIYIGTIGEIKLEISAPSLNTALFIASITAFELLIVYYWIALKLLPTLPYFGLVAFATALTGRRALGDVRARRLKREGKMAKSE